MAKNRVYSEFRTLFLEVGAGVKSGDPVRVGHMNGVALTDADANNYATVDFGGVYNLSVKAVNDAGNSAVSVGDHIYLVDADTPKLSKKNSGYFFGCALEAIDTGQTATIKVVNMAVPGPGTADILAGAIGTEELSAGALAASDAGRGKMADGFFDANTVLAKFDANSIPVEKLAADARLAALVAAGLGASAVIAHDDDDSPAELLAANGTGDGNRAVLVVAICNEAAGGETPSTFKVGETGTVEKFFSAATLAAAADGDVLVSAGTLTEEKALIVTYTAGDGDGAAGAFQFLVLALPEESGGA